MIWLVLRSHLMPDQVHHMGWYPGLEKAVEGSQSWNVLRGSLRDDFIERRDISWRGGETVAAAAAVERTNENLTRIKEMENEKQEKKFMVLELRR